jgi:hypothetical protein
MPKININEQDFTTPGGSFSYANYAVLVVGYEGEEPDVENGQTKHPTSERLAETRIENEKGTEVEVYNRPVAPDSNNVYEFSSAQDFAETIGLAAPERQILGVDGSVIGTTYHYGNRMAYELLNLGFSVLYKPIKSQKEVWDENTWEVFKDKVSYDFRFISHGLLESDATALTVPSRYDENTGLYIPNEVDVKKQLAAIAVKQFEGEAGCLPNWKQLLKIEVDPSLYSNPTGYNPTLRYNATTLTDKPILNTIKAEGNGYSHQDDYAIERALLTKEACMDKMICHEAEKEAHWRKLEEQLATIYSHEKADIETSYSEYKELYTYMHTKFADAPVEDVFPEAFADSTTKTKSKTPSISSSTFIILWNDLAVAIDTLYQASLEFVKETDINRANSVIANLASYFPDDHNNDEAAAHSGRGDCVALIELDEKVYTTGAAYEKPEKLIINGIKKITLKQGSGSYCALTVPSVYYTSLENEASSAWKGSKKMPASFHYLTCFLRALRQNYAEWYATAGYTRGVSSLVIERTSVKLGELAINALEPRNMKDETSPPFACNVIANFRGSYYLWGNRTCEELGAAASREKGDLIASHFLNIRQLCVTIKKKLFTACRQFTFDPNSDVLWVNFCNAIRPTLDNMRADQGIRDYKIIKLETTKKATLKAKIRIIPIEAVEDFILEVSLDDDFGVAIAG